MNRTTTLILMTVLVLFAGQAGAQCTIAAYADQGGVQSYLWAPWGLSEPFSMYVVLFAEDTAAAAAYKLVMPYLGTEVFIQGRIAGPSGNGLILDEATGTNVALAECVYGFFGAPILIEEIVLVALPYPTWWAIPVTLEANTNQGETPVYVNCTNVEKPCDPGPTLYITVPDLAGEETSFGEIKSLYH